MLGLTTGEVLEQFLSAMPFGVVVLDRDLKYRWANDAFAKMSGVSDVTGFGIGSTYPQLGERVAPVLRAVMETGEPFEWVVHGGTELEAGEGRSWRARYVPLRRVEGSIAGVAAMLIDITHEARLERAQTGPRCPRRGVERHR